MTARARPTMHQVAEAAGVSLKTVSRVVNAEPGVRPETAERVLRAVTALGFRRNDLARSLRQGHSSATVGLVIEDVTNPFYSGIARAVEEVATKRGYLLISASCGEDPERERELVTMLFRRRIDALLIVPAAGGDESYLAAEMALGTPAVFLDRPPRGIEADTVVLDNVGGARRAVEHLIAHGHRRVAAITDALTVHTAGERLLGYRQAVESAGLGYDARLVRSGAADRVDAQAAVQELLALPASVRPTAIFTGNNRVTVGALRDVRAAEPPIALVGFDDFELADLLGISVVRYEAAEIGRHAADLAFARVEDPARPPHRVVVPTELVVRGSAELR